MKGNRKKIIVVFLSLLTAILRVKTGHEGEDSSQHNGRLLFSNPKQNSENCFYFGVCLLLNLELDKEDEASVRMTFILRQMQQKRFQ